MAKISIQNAKISSSEAYGIYHGTTQLVHLSQSAVAMTGSLVVSASIPSADSSLPGSLTDLFKIGDNYMYASQSGEIGIGTLSPSALLEISGSGDKDFLIVQSGTLQAAAINSRGVVVLGSYGAGKTPPAVAGGLFFSGSNNFFLGFS